MSDSFWLEFDAFIIFRVRSVFCGAIASTAHEMSTKTVQAPSLYAFANLLQPKKNCFQFTHENKTFFSSRAFFCNAITKKFKLLTKIYTQNIRLLMLLQSSSTLG